MWSAVPLLVVAGAVVVAVIASLATAPGVRSLLTLATTYLVGIIGLLLLPLGSLCSQGDGACYEGTGYVWALLILPFSMGLALVLILVTIARALRLKRQRHASMKL